jgi:hypothetical protein
MVVLVGECLTWIGVEDAEPVILTAGAVLKHYAPICFDPDTSAKTNWSARSRTNTARPYRCGDIFTRIPSASQYRYYAQLAHAESFLRPAPPSMVLYARIRRKSVL